MQWVWWSLAHLNCSIRILWTLVNAIPQEKKGFFMTHPIRKSTEFCVGRILINSGRATMCKILTVSKNQQRIKEVGIGFGLTDWVTNIKGELFPELQTQSNIIVCNLVVCFSSHGSITVHHLCCEIATIRTCTFIGKIKFCLSHWIQPIEIICAFHF